MKKQKQPSMEAGILRRKAELLLEKNALKNGSQFTDANNMRLIHELEVHQIELEMQNEELTQAKEEAEIASQKYLELYDFAPSGYFTISIDGKIIDLNLRGSQLLGKDCKFLKNSLFGLFVSPDTRLIFDNFLKRIFSGKTKETCELTLSVHKHPPIYVYLTGMISGNGEKCLVNMIDISERRQAETALRESEERNRTILLQTSMDGFLRLDRQGSLLEVNEPYCKMSGYSIQELLAMNISDLEVVEEVEDTKAHIEKVIAQGDEHFDTRHRRKDGSIFDVEISVQYQSAEGGRFVAFLHDITERKSAVENLRQSEERYKSLFQGNHSVMLLINPDTGEIKDANPSASLYYGWSHSEICSKNISEINVLSRDEVKEKMQKAKEGKCNHFFFKHRRQDGEVRDVEVFSGPVIYSGFTLLYSIVHDVTERQRAEESLKEKDELLNKAQEIAHLGSWSLDLVTNRLGWSEEMYRIFGMKPQDLDATYEGFLDAVHPEDRDAVNSAYTNSILEGKDSYEIEHRIVRRHSGEVRYVLEKCEHIRDASGKIIRSVGMTHDISERKMAEEALRENERLLREAQSLAHLGSYEVDMITQTWKASPEIYEIFGIDETYPPTLKAWAEIIHPDFQLEVTSYLLHVEVEKSRFDHEYKIIRFNDCAERWVHGIGVFEYDNEMNPVKLIGTVQDITEPKQVEEELLISSEKIRETVYDLNKAESVALLGYWKWNIKTREVAWSDGMYRIFGIDKNTYSGRLGDVISKVIHPDDLHLVLPSNAESFIRQKPIEYRIIMPDNSIRYIAAEAGENIVDSNGNTTYLTGVAQDITARKQAEIALKQLNEELDDRVKERTSELVKSNLALQLAEEKYRTVADYTHDWEYWINPENGYNYVSPSCERITGYKAEEFIANPGLVLDIVHSDDRKAFLAFQQKETLNHNCLHENHFRIVRSDGSIRWIENIRHAIYDDSGNYLGIRGSKRDITDRKKMEQLLKTSNRKYRLVSANISDGIFICRNGSFEYVNRAMNHIFGYDGDELIDKQINQLILPEYSGELDFIYSLKAPFNQKKNIEIECLKKDRSSIFVEFLFNYVATEGVIYGVVHDITDRKMIQKSIVKAIILTEEKERIHFSKELHDGLGPLLSTIKLHLQWSERTRNKKSREEIIRKAEEVIEDSILAVKEISNKLSPHLLINYGLCPAIQSFIGKLEQTMTVHIVFHSNLSRRLGNEIEAAIYRAIIECLNNTVKHSGAKNVTIGLIDTGEQLQVQYRDDGIGFDLEEALAIKKGLGLFNLQNRIQNIGGKITMYSQPGKGVDYQIKVNL